MKSKVTHTTSYLQSFGCMVITDQHMNVVGISHEALRWSGYKLEEVLGFPVELYLKKTVGTSTLGFIRIIQDVLEKRIPRQVITKKVYEKDYYFKFNSHQDHVYIEWEPQHKKHITASRLDELAFLFDQTYPANWNMVCHAINRLISFDRVFVLQVMETGYSRVVAEHASSQAESFKGKEFSNDFMPEEIISYYMGHNHRYNPNIKSGAQKFYCNEEYLDTEHSQLGLFPDMHTLFFQNIEVGSVLFFPLLFNGEFWGMVCAHHSKPKKVDLQTRKLCSFVTQNAMSKYENRIKQGLLDYNLQILQVEEQIKEEMIKQKTINCALVNNMDLLLRMTRSDGLALFHEGDVYFHGSCPAPEQFYEIVDYLENNTDKTVFKDYNFKRNHGSEFKDDLPFAGLLSYSIKDDEKDHYLVWFRNEVLSSVTHIKIVDVDVGTTNIKITKSKGKYKGQLNNPGKTIKTWQETVLNSSLPWDETDLMFVDSLRRIVDETQVSKMKERQILTEELVTLNNELEMFTFTLSHDLRNPLSILGMGLQFLKASDSKIPAEKRIEWYQNLLGSVNNIEDIINNIVTLSQSKTSALAKSPVPLSYTIRKVAREATMLHEIDNCHFHYGSLYPVWGEKSALYQIFLNLIGNAVKYSSKDRQPEIWINSLKDGNNIYYEIKDNGIGIPKNNLPHIFEMFLRADNARGHKGTGVGLSLVKRIIDRLGGSIEIASKENEGTEIKLTFPIVDEFPPSMLTELKN